ncbi:MAG: plasmid pRiA4b ORF-3 family protein [Myxococcales bacterium]|nr:plasmid pRiA4b ORF-3 family protein [Myxococcales bacterium]
MTGWRTSKKKASGKKASSNKTPSEKSPRKKTPSEEKSPSKKPPREKSPSPSPKSGNSTDQAAAKPAKAGAKAAKGGANPTRSDAAQGSKDVGLRLVPPLQEPLPSNVLPLFPDFEPDHEWVMGLLPADDSKGGYHAVLFLEAGTKTVVHFELVKHTSAALLVQAVRRALDHMRSRGRRLPTRLRVAFPEHAALLQQGGLEGITIVVGPTAELDGLHELPSQGHFALEDLEEHDRYRGAADVTDEHLMTFFEAAITFRRSKPWQALSPGMPLVFMLPALELEQGALAVTGQGAEGGLMVLPDVAALSDDQLPDVLETGALPAQSLAMIFVRRADLSEARDHEIASMHFAPRRGPYPLLLAMDDEQRFRPTTGLDYEVAIAAMLAVDAFVSDYSPVLECSSLRSLMACYPMKLGHRDRVDVHVGIPDVWDEDEEGDAALAGESPLEYVFELPPLTPPSQVCRLRIGLQGTKPPIWRRVEVPASITLARLHDVIQAVMGWDDCHLHRFDVGRERFGPPSDDPFAREVHDEGQVALGDVAAKGHVLEYVYDFGDHWVHRIKVEEVYEPATPLPRPRCTGGKRACPPEDCGGVPGLAWGLEQLAQGHGDDLPEMLMAFEGFDPAAFDPKAADAVLERVFRDA